MKLLVDETKLDLLLEKKRQYIGSKSFMSHVNNATSSAMLLAGASSSSFSSVWILTGEQMEWASMLVGIWGLVWSLWNMGVSVVKGYSVDEFRKDIHDLSEIEHPYSIIAVKDSFNEYPNRYLLYYDKKWGCNFFPNYKTAELNNEDNIRQRLSAELKVAINDISVEKRGYSVHTKYSVSNKRYKTYAHTLYFAEIKNFPERLKADSFSVEGRKFGWWTIHNMEADKQIQEKNLDVVAFVKNNIA